MGGAHARKHGCKRAWRERVAWGPGGNGNEVFQDFYCDSPEELAEEMEILRQALKKLALDLDDGGREGKTHAKCAQPEVRCSRL